MGVYAAHCMAGVQDQARLMRMLSLLRPRRLLCAQRLHHRLLLLRLLRLVYSCCVAAALGALLAGLPFAMGSGLGAGRLSASIGSLPSPALALFRPCVALLGTLLGLPHFSPFPVFSADCCRSGSPHTCRHHRRCRCVSINMRMLC